MAFSASWFIASVVFIIRNMLEVHWTIIVTGVNLCIIVTGVFVTIVEHAV